MKYLCLIYEDQTTWDRFTPDEQKKEFAAYGKFTQDVASSGHLVGGEALQPTQTATTVRVRNGSISTTDGPFAETKEQLGGYYLIEAKDLDDAIKVASQIPSAQWGAVEVRPIMDTTGV